LRNFTENNYATNTSQHLYSSKAKRGLEILRHSERNALGHTQTPTLLKADIVVYVHHLTQHTLSNCHICSSDITALYLTNITTFYYQQVPNSHTHTHTHFDRQTLP